MSSDAESRKERPDRKGPSSDRAERVTVRGCTVEGVTAKAETSPEEGIKQPWLRGSLIYDRDIKAVSSTPTMLGKVCNRNEWI